MTNVPYNTNIPFSSNNPSQDQPLMQENTNSLKSLIEIDHIGFGNNQGGYHKVIHQPDNVTDPAILAGLGQHYTKTVGADIQFFYESALGVITQLTGPTAPLAAVKGYVYLPGGILLQWGRQTGVTSGSFSGGNAEGTAAYGTPFPTAVWNVITVPFYTTVPSDAASINPNLSSFLTLTGFTWRLNTNSNKYTGFCWLAIGN
jgi:hypothetical protein